MPGPGSLWALGRLQQSSNPVGYKETQALAGLTLLMIESPQDKVDPNPGIDPWGETQSTGLAKHPETARTLEPLLAPGTCSPWVAEGPALWGFSPCLIGLVKLSYGSAEPCPAQNQCVTDHESLHHQLRGRRALGNPVHRIPSSSSCRYCVAFE